jgi:hypothetical protein
VIPRFILTFDVILDIMYITIENNTLEIDMKLNEINYALKDIQETLAIWRDDKEWNDPYILKLYREFDKLIVMKQKIMEKR